MTMHKQIPLFGVQKWIQLGHISQVANFWKYFGNIEIVELQVHFTKMMTSKPKIVKLTKVTEQYQFLESKMKTIRICSLKLITDCHSCLIDNAIQASKTYTYSICSL